MTLEQLLARTRDKLDDTTVPYLWSDEELVAYLNDFMDEVTGEALCFQDPSSFSNTLVENQFDYPTDSKVIRIISASRSADGQPLTRRTKDYMETYYPGWRSHEAGTPRIYLTDWETGKLTVYPKPDATAAADSAAVDLNVYRKQTTPLSASTLTASPEIDSRFHLGLINGILKHAYEKPDEETYDPVRAKDHSDKADKFISDVKKSIIVRDWSTETVRPRRGCL